MIYWYGHPWFVAFLLFFTGPSQATGGTAGAACKLVHQVGAIVAEVSVFIELKDLNGTSKLPEGTPFYSMYQF